MLLPNLFRFYRNSDGFELAGGSEPVAIAPEPATEPAPAAATATPATAETAPNSETTPADAEPRNAAEWVLRLNGFEGDKIKFGDQERAIAELTAEEQLNILTSEYEGLYEQLQAAPRDEQEIAYLQALRTGGAVALANYILENNPAARVQRLSAEQLVEGDLRSRYGEDYSEEDIQADIEALRSTGRLEKQAEVLRKRAAQQAGGLDLNGFTTQPQADPEFQSRLSQAVDEFSEFGDESVAKFEINPEARNWLKSYVVAPKGAKSQFDQVLEDPKAKRDAAFWYAYGPKLMAQVAQSNYEAGRAESDQLIGRMGGTKARTYKPKQYGNTGAAVTGSKEKGTIQTF